MDFKPPPYFWTIFLTNVLGVAITLGVYWILLVVFNLV